MSNPTPLTDRQLDEIEARAAHLYEYARQHGDGEGDTLAGEDVPALVDEVRRLRAELAAGRAQAWRDLADRADPQRPEISFFSDHGHEVGAWMRKQAEYEDRNAAARPAVETGA